LNSKVTELGTKKGTETTNLTAAKAAETKAAEEAKAAQDAKNAELDKKATTPDLNIQGGFKPSDITVSQTKEQWQANIENLKGHLEGMNNQSQLDMIKFQSLMSKYTAQTEALSNVMKKLGDNYASLVGNLR
jgi:hypothetical protein